MIITNSRYALVGYFITSYLTRAHGIVVIYTMAAMPIKTPGLHCTMIQLLIILVRFALSFFLPFSLHSVLIIFQYFVIHYVCAVIIKGIFVIFLS